MKQPVILATDKSCIRRNLEWHSEAQLYIVANLFSSTHTIHFFYSQLFNNFQPPRDYEEDSGYS